MLNEQIATNVGPGGIDDFDLVCYVVIERGGSAPIVMIESRCGAGWSPASKGTRHVVGRRLSNTGDPSCLCGTAGNPS